MSFALPPEMRDYIDDRVRCGHFGNTSEYIRSLIRQDQEAQAAQRFRDLIADGLTSGDGRLVTAELLTEIRERALSDAV